jgi:tetratricopeptide (TPR) repeat protein
MTELATALRQPSQDWFVGVYRSLMDLHRGRLDEAERLIEDTWRTGARTQGWNAEVTYCLQRYVLHLHRWQLPKVEERLRRLARENPTYRIFDCAVAHLEALLGYDSRETYELLVADDFAGLPFDEEWLVSVGFLAQAAHAHGDAARAAVLYEQLAPYADRVSISYPEVSLGSTSRYLGILAATASRFDQAAEHFEHAIEVNTRVDAQAWLAHTHHDYGEMLMALESREAACEHLERAVAGYTQLGMDHWAAEAAAVKAPSRGTRASVRAPG